MAATKLFRESRNELDNESVELEKAAAALVVKVKDKASEARKAAVNAGTLGTCWPFASSSRPSPRRSKRPPRCDLRSTT